MATLQEICTDLGQKARKAACSLTRLTEDEKNKILMKMSEDLLANKERIMKANALDVQSAKDNGITEAMVDRLSLDEIRIEGIAEGVRQVVALEDPTHKVLSQIERPNGLIIKQVSVPIGVALIIYESRPNVTIDAAALNLKAGNAVILRGGKEAFETNKVLVDIMIETIGSLGYAPHLVQFVPLVDREAFTYLLKMNKFIDVVIPRGSAGLIERVVNESSIPVIETGSGICHMYVDESGDLEMAKNLVMNGKVQRPSVCNSVETLLVHKAIGKEFLKLVAPSLIDAKVELRCDATTGQFLNELGMASLYKSALEEDWRTEYNDLILSIKAVSSVEEAIEHIEAYGTRHSECIITNDQERANLFMESVDSSTVYVNASTRFTDGFEFGFGAEIGISTQKLHARGPMGLPALTTYKYFVYGQGQVRK